MTCFSPIQGFESIFITDSGKYSFTYNPDYARRVDGKRVERVVKCRKCEGCRFDNSREWAVKILHESSCHKDNAFITLTYQDSKMPLYGGLDYKGDWTRFLKRLRKAVFKKYNKKIRFYVVGEYGEINLRPHYHAIIFGFDFPDKRPYLERLGNIIYRSDLLESCWIDPDDGVSFGYSSVGDVNFQTAAYVARYSMKKLIGNQVESFEDIVDGFGEVRQFPVFSERYVRVDPLTGNKVNVERERAFMSLKPGIGKEWFDKYAFTDMYSAVDTGNGLVFKDHTHLFNGTLVRPPKYYDKLLERLNPKMLEDIKLARQDYISCHVDDLSPDILRQKRECLLSKLKNKTRNIGDVYSDT